MPRTDDELFRFAFWLYIAAEEAGQVGVVRRLVRDAWELLVDLHGLPDEDELDEVKHPLDVIDDLQTETIGKFASYWDDMEREHGLEAARESEGVPWQGYRLLKSLEGGGMAEAYRATHIATGRKVFLKRVHTSSEDRPALEREMRIYEKLSRLQLGHVAGIIEWLKDPDYVALVTEFADGGDLQEFVRRMGGALWSPGPS